MLPLWFGNELLQALFWDSAGMAGGTAYWAHVGGFAFGVAGALGVRALRFEERFVDPGVEARIVVASVETYLRYAESIGVTGIASRPAIPSAATDLDRIRAENIDEAKVEEARQRAAARLQEKISDEEVATVNASMVRALAQLQVRRRHRPR